MTSGMTVPRVAMSASPHFGGARTPNLPVIEHPMAKLGNKNELTIRGSSSLGRHNDQGLTNGQQNGDLHHSVDLGVKNAISVNTNNKLHRSSVDGIPAGGKDRMLHWPPDESQTRITERLLTNREGKPLSPLCEYVPPFKYRRSAAERVGLIKEPPKPKKPKKKNKGIYLPPIENLPAGESSSARENYKLPSLATFMDFIEDDQDYVIGPRGMRTRTKLDSSSLTSRNTFEVVDIVKEKLTTGYVGLKHLFKANDPIGHGNEVSREALLRILYTFCGYISPDQYSKFLRKIGLEGRDTISFDSFVGCFRDNETVKKQWVSPIQRIEVEKANKRRLLEEGLRSTNMTVPDPYLSAPFADAILKEKLKTIDDARMVFPAACFGPSGMIVPPQLREAYAQCGAYMTDRDFDTLWQRYDREGIGAIWTERFLKTIGVTVRRPQSFNAKELPKPRPHESLQRPKSENVIKGLVKASEQGEKQKKSPKEKEITKAKTENDQLEQPQEVQVTPANNASDVVQPPKEVEHVVEEPRVKIPKKSRQQHPKLDNIIDCLHYRFEESYNAMLTACQLFDYMSDNFLSRVDFRRILQEFGFNISVTEMDSFLARIGVRTIRSQINYKEFLNKFQSKAENSITNRIVTNQYHMFQNDAQTPHQSGMVAEELEAKLVELFHGDFIKLITHFRTCDKYNLGVITAHEFRSGIERRLGYAMSDKQWDQLQADVGRDQDGLVPYTKFLQLFDIIPGSWNRKLEDGALVTCIPQSDLGQTQEVDKLRDKARVAMVPQELEKPKLDNTRTFNDVLKLVEEMFKNRFHTFDKVSRMNTL